MKLERFKEKNKKRTGIFVFTIVCILLVSGVILYRTFAIFEVKTNQNIIKGTVEDPGNIYFAFYVDNKIQKDMPDRNGGFVLDEEASYCGVNGNKIDTVKVSLTEDWKIVVSGVTTSRTKCNLFSYLVVAKSGKPLLLHSPFAMLRLVATRYFQLITFYFLLFRIYKYIL